MTYNLVMDSIGGNKVYKPSSKWKRTIAFGIAFMGLILSILAGGYVWSANFTVQLVSASFFTIVCIVYLTFGWIKKIKLPKTGLEWGIVLGILAFLTSLFFSSNWTTGIWRLISLLNLGIVFYCLVDLFEDEDVKTIVLEALIWVTGIVTLLAVFEIGYAYRQYWLDTGFVGGFPPTPYRVTGVLGHANALMALANLCAPITMILFFKTKNPLKKISLLIWIFMYFFILPFTSSRGGWLGAITWVILLTFFFVQQKKWWGVISTFIQGRKTWIIPLIVIFLAILVILGYFFVVKFTGYRLANANPFSGRSEMWESGQSVWKKSPWFGVGPGRFALEIFSVVNNIPPKYWPSHAHNLIINILAEFGLFGLLASILIFIALVVQVKKNFFGIRGEGDIRGKAIIASLAGLAMQMLVDDFSTWLAIMIPAIILIAILISHSVKSLPRYSKLSQGWLLIPLLISTTLTAWWLWVYCPLASAFSEKDTNPRRKAELITIASSRATTQSYIHWQAGLAWSQEYAESLDPRSLNYAIEHFEKFIQLEPNFSLAWANIGVLYAQTNKEESYSAFLKAIELAPRVPSYYLNFAIQLEKNGDDQAARQAYLEALKIMPAWGGDKFWSITSLRREVLENWEEMNQISTDETMYSSQAVDRIKQGELDVARKLIANAKWIGEPELSILTAQASLAEAMGKKEEIKSIIPLMVTETNKNSLDSANSIAATFALWITHMKGFSDDLVPGYIQLNPDYGQDAFLGD